jgi:hypothetical protein
MQRTERNNVDNCALLPQNKDEVVNGTIVCHTCLVNRSHNQLDKLGKPMLQRHVSRQNIEVCLAVSEVESTENLRQRFASSLHGGLSACIMRENRTKPFLPQRWISTLLTRKLVQDTTVNEEQRIPGWPTRAIWQPETHSLTHRCLGCPESRSCPSPLFERPPPRCSRCTLPHHPIASRLLRTPGPPTLCKAQCYK